MREHEIKIDDFILNKDMSDYKNFYKYEYHGLRGYYLISWTEFDGKICEYSKKKEWKQNNKLIHIIDFVNGIGFLPNSWKKMLHREKMTIENYPQYEKLKEMYPNGEYKNVEW